MKTILLISPYWKEPHRWMVSSVKLAELWQRLGYRVVVVCMGSETGIEVVSPTLTIHRRKDLFLKDPLNYGIAVGFSGYVARLARSLKPDVIIVNKILFWSSLSLIGLRLRGYRVLLLTDAFVGMTWFPRGRFPRVIMTAGAWTVGWFLMRLCTRLITFHPQSPDLLKKLGIWKKTEVIPTGIDVTGYQDAKTKGQKSETKSDVSGHQTVTYVGRLESVKGVDNFLAAVVPLKKQFPHLHVRVVGWFTEKNELVTQYGHDVEFTGLRDDIPAILAETDIFVLASYSEGLSNALMEAMTSGCACVASDVGGNRFLLQNGVSGFLFPAGDREALAAHVRRLLDDPPKARALGEAARTRIDEQFSWDRVGRLYQTLFEEFRTKM